jgi:hypothetical protein
MWVCWVSAFVHRSHVLVQGLKPRARDASGGAHKTLVHHLIRQTHGFEDLSALLVDLFVFVCYWLG